MIASTRGWAALSAARQFADHEFVGRAVTYDMTGGRAGKVRTDQEYRLAGERAKNAMTRGLGCCGVVVGG